MALDVRIISGVVGTVKLSVQPVAQNMNALCMNNVNFFKNCKGDVGGQSITVKIRTDSSI